MKNTFFLRCILILLVSLIIWLPAKSEEIVVIATPIKGDTQGSVVDKVPTAFTEVVKTNKYSAGLVNTTEAMKRAASIDLPDYGGALTSPISVRGSSFQDTLVLLDGMRLNPVSGDMVDISLFPISEIEQIEIIRGSNSASFGKSAMGGVINIVSKNPTMKKTLDFTSSQGSYGYSLHNAHINTYLQDIGIMLNLTKGHADNDFLYEKEDGSTAKRLNNDTDNVSVLAKAWFEYGGWDTALMVNVFDQSKGSPGSEGSAGWLTPNDEITVTQANYQIATTKVLSEAVEVDLKTSRLHNRTSNYIVSFGDKRSKLVNDDIDLALRIDLGPVSLRPELYYIKEQLSSDEYGMHTRYSHSGILSACAEHEPVALSVTGRYDNSSDFERRWTYHAGIVWDVKGPLDLRANAGTAYHEPSMGQLYTPSTYYTFIPNPELEPEKSFSWDIGPAISCKHIGFGASYFVADYRDMIKMDYPAPYEFTYVNVAKTHATGIEAYAWVEPSNLVRVSANYTYNNFRYASGNYESKNLKQKPKQVTNIQIDIYPMIWNRQVNVFCLYQFRQGIYTDEANTEKTGNRDILNAGLIINLSDNASISFKVKNMFDDTSPEFKDKSEWGSWWFPLVGRTYNFALQLSF